MSENITIDHFFNQTLLKMIIIYGSSSIHFSFFSEFACNRRCVSGHRVYGLAWVLFGNHVNIIS